MVASLLISRGWICSTHGRELRKGCFAQLTTQDVAQAVTAACAAALMSCTTSCGWETIATWLDGTSTVVAPMRLANRRWASGGIASSFVATRNQVGSAFQAG